MTASSLVGGALSGRFLRLLVPFEPGASFVTRAAGLRAASDTAWGKGEVERQTPAALAPPWGLPGVDASVPLAWRDEGTGVVRFGLRLESRSVPKTAVLDAAEAESLSKHRRPLMDLLPGQRKALLDQTKGRLLGAYPSTVRFVEGYALSKGMLFLALPTAAHAAPIQGLLRELFGPISLHPGVVFSQSGGWDAAALSVLAEGAKAEGGRLSEDVQVRSVRLQDANVRINTRDAGIPVSALLRELVAQRPLPTVHQIGFSVLHQGVLREVDVDFEGVCRVFPPPSGYGLWSDRILRRHQDAMDILARVHRAIDAARRAIGSKPG
jgi:hypothetical protein